MYKISPKHKIVFKIDPRDSGLAGVGQMRGAYILHRKQKIGRIHRNSMHMGNEPCMYKVGFIISPIDLASSTNSPESTTWKWRYFKVAFKEMAEAQEWVTTNIHNILNKFEQDGYTISPLTN